MYNSQLSIARRALANMVVLVVGLCYLAIAQPLTDVDNDGLSDQLEMQLGQRFLPNIWDGPAEECGPLWSDQHWCLDGQRGSQHQKGFIGYDVVDLGFSDLLAIEYTLFLDYDCGILGFEQHDFDNEGFTVVIRRVGSDYDLVSAQTFAHHGTSVEMVDKLYPHELDKFWFPGLLVSENKHGFYVHHGICERNIYDLESCAQPPNAVLVNDRCVQGLYDTSPCPCCADIAVDSCRDCWDTNLGNPDCWSRRLQREGVFLNPANQCLPFDVANTNPVERRKELPPYIPIDVQLPENLAYVDLYEHTGFTANSQNVGDAARLNFGDALVNAGMPMRLFEFPDPAWWREYYDPTYMRSKDEQARGLWSYAHRYVYWDRDAQIYYRDGTVHSLILYGLPGTEIVIYDHDDGNLFFLGAYTVPDGQRFVAIADLGALSTMEFVSWAFGPTADAGNDKHILCGDSVLLDGRVSYQYAPDTATLRSVFGVDLSVDTLRDSAFNRLWKYEWFDETNAQFLDSGAVISARLSCGSHRIRLNVSGRRYPYPDNPSYSYEVVVKDWCTIDVDLVTPEKIGVAELCEGVELYWDTTGCGFGYEVFRDGILIADVGPGNYFIDSTAGTHDYSVHSYNEFRQTCGSMMIGAAAKDCDRNDYKIPSTFMVRQNIPNPFNSGTTIEYGVPTAAHVTIDIFNIAGQKVRTLVNEPKSPGLYRIDWNGTDDAGKSVSTGVYLYRLMAGGIVQTKKMVLLK